METEKKTIRLNWSGIFGDKFLSSEKANARGPSILKNRLKGGFCRNEKRSEGEIVKIISEANISDNPEDVFNYLTKSNIGIGYASNRSFSLKRLVNCFGGVQYIVGTHKIDEFLRPINSDSYTLH